MISVISSLTPITTAVPLIGVLALTAIKDAYDDFVSILYLYDKPWLLFLNKLIYLYYYNYLLFMPF